MSDTIVRVLPFSVDISQPLKKTYMDTLFATEDNQAHRFYVSLLKNKAQMNLPAGSAVSGYFIRYCDNATISLTGEAAGNTVSVTLKKSCYNRSGQFALIIKAISGDVTSTVFYGEGTMLASSTDTILDEENVIPSISDLLNQIATIEAATKAAGTAAGNANAAAQSASTAAAKIDGMTVSASSSTTAGATISEKNGVKHIAFSLPKGEKGDKGDPGTIENVTITSIDGLSEALNSKQPKGNYLASDGTAADSYKLGGVAASEYAKKTDIPEESDIDLLSMYPVGSIYMSVSNTSPASLFGGTWEQMKDRFLLGAGGSYSAGATGGEATHTLTVDELPSISGGFAFNSSGGTVGIIAGDSTSGVFSNGAKVANSGVPTKGSASDNVYRSLNMSFGSDQPHNNMPPYLAVYMWKRVS